jgi:tetratricopeptide (TPR) repeat protein
MTIQKLILVGLTLILSSVALAGINDDYKKLENLYYDAQFDQVVLKSGDLLANPALATADSVRVVKLLAKAAAQAKQPDMAQKYLAILVKMDPATEFNADAEPQLFARTWIKFVNDTGFKSGQSQGSVTVYAADFSNGSIVDADKYRSAGIGVASLINSQLSQSGAVSVPARENFNMIFDELKMSQTDLADQKNRLQVGKLVGVQNFIFGTFMKMEGNKVRVIARIIDTETSLPKKVVDVEGKEGKIGQMISQVADSIMAYFNVQTEAKKASLKVPDVSLAATLFYSQGLAYREANNLEQANKYFAQALEASPNFVLASEQKQRVELEIKAGRQ